MTTLCAVPADECAATTIADFTSPSADGQEPSTSKVAAVGETWARLFGISDAHVAIVGHAYEASISDPKVWAVEGSWHGHRAVIARLGHAHVLATPSGFHIAMNIPSKLRRPRGLRWPLQRDQLQHTFHTAADFIACIADACPAVPWKIHLSSFGAWARETAGILARDDLLRAFNAVMPPKESSKLFHNASAKAERSYHHTRVPFYLRQLGAALRALRSMMPDQVRTTLWSIAAPDFRLASWLMASEAHRLYRCQALKTQPLLLPLALLGLPYENEDVCKGALAQVRLPDVYEDGEERREPTIARALLDAIDAGKPWFDHLENMLSSAACNPHHPITVANIRWLAGRSPRFLWWTRHSGSDLRSPLDAAMSLPGNRQPTNRYAWARFASFIRSLPVTNFPASFLKGMPCEWTEKPWLETIEMMPTVRDAIAWISGNRSQHYYHDALNVWHWLFRHATLRQVLNFSEAAHAIHAAEEAAFRLEWQAQREDEIRWTAVFPERHFAHKNLVVTELTTAGELEEEGARLTHCIAGYAHSCVTGRSRILSIRNTAGASLSSVELWCQADPKTHQTRLVVAQHRAHHNRAPSAACEEAIEAFQQAARSGLIAVNMLWPQGVLPWDRRQMELTNRVRDAISRELFRRWPTLRLVVEAQPQHPLVIDGEHP